MFPSLGSTSWVTSFSSRLKAIPSFVFIIYTPSSTIASIKLCSARASLVDEGTPILESSTGSLISVDCLSGALGPYSSNVSFIICSLLTDCFNCSLDQTCSGSSIALFIFFGQCRSQLKVTRISLDLHFATNCISAPPFTKCMYYVVGTTEWFCKFLCFLCFE